MATVTATCSGGKRAIGGGGAVMNSGGSVTLTNNSDIVIDVSAPAIAGVIASAGQVANQWQVRATNVFLSNDVAWTLLAYVICASTSP